MQAGVHPEYMVVGDHMDSVSRLGGLKLLGITMQGHCFSQCIILVIIAFVRAWEM